MKCSMHNCNNRAMVELHDGRRYCKSCFIELYKRLKGAGII